MQMKWKKTGAALLVATITVTGGSYAWANENLFDTVNLNDVLKQNETVTEKTPEKTTEVPTGDSVKEVVTTEDSAGLDITIPEGYTAGNLKALSKAYENAGNETAKAAIKRNAERAIAKFEASQKEETEVDKPEVEKPVQEEPTIVEPVKEEPVKVETVTEKTVVEKPVEVAPEEEKVKEDTTKKEVKAVEKEERKALQAEQKEERKALQAKQKEERNALKAEHKAEKQENKKNKKDEK
ncbi:hypothetical protein [Bacillus sp. FJAT-22090]|uniref:hypothetical protein n=1 Tax=Bacillus sp. FJAT-22090 TaxID=1581038 RepID=UPI0011AAFA02|nr:hypothetical protein [Bacillus sp. FJAT-22090]